MAAAAVTADYEEDPSSTSGEYTSAIRLAESAPDIQLDRLLRMDELAATLPDRTAIVSVLDYMVLLWAVRKSVVNGTILRRPFSFTHGGMVSNALVFEACFWQSSITDSCCRLMAYHVLTDFIPKRAYQPAKEALHDIASPKARELCWSVTELGNLLMATSESEWNQLHVGKTNMNEAQLATIESMTPSVLHARVRMLAAMNQLYGVVKKQKESGVMKPSDIPLLKKQVGFLFESLAFIQKAHTAYKDGTAQECRDACRHVLYMTCAKICELEDRATLRLWCIEQSPFQEYVGSDLKAAKAYVESVGETELKGGSKKEIPEFTQIFGQYKSLKVAEWPALTLSEKAKEWTLREHLPVFDLAK